MKDGKIRKGSMTVEAALVIPAVLMMIVALILLTTYIYNRTWYTSASAEAVITASTEGVRSCGDTNRVLSGKMTEKIRKQGLPLTDISAKTTAQKDEVKSEVQITTLDVWGMGGWKMNIAEKTGIVRPVPFIRSIQALGVWKEAAG